MLWMAKYFVCMQYYCTSVIPVITALGMLYIVLVLVSFRTNVLTKCMSVDSVKYQEHH